MKDYDIYLFDWDGTIAESTTTWLRAIRRQFDALGLHPADDEILRRMGDWELMLDLGITQAQLKVIRDAARKEALERVTDAPLFDNVHNLLVDLKRRGKKLAVVTAMHRNIVETLIAHHDYGELFDVVVSGTDVGKLKPHPEALLLALQLLDRQPHETVLMLGDTERDILAAHSAGIDSLLYYPPAHQVFHDLEELKGHHPTYIISDWKELA